MKVLAASMESGDLSLYHFNLGSKYNDGVKLLSNMKVPGQGKSAYIQKMMVIQRDAGPLVIVAKRGHILQVYEGDSLKLLHEWKSNMNVQPNDSVVGLEYDSGIIYTCSVSGKIMIRDMKNGPLHRFGMAKARDPISCFKLHPKQKGIAAFGGKDNDLEVIHIMFPSMNSSSGNSASGGGAGGAGDGPADRLRPLGLPRSLAFSHDIHPGSDSDIDDNMMCNPALFNTWKARNLRANQQGEEADPVWISDLQFLDTDRSPSEGWRIATATRYGELRIYETNQSKRPIINVRLSHHPIASLSLNYEETKLFFTDVQKLTGDIDSTECRKVRFYERAPGTSLYADTCFPEVMVVDYDSCPTTDIMTHQETSSVDRAAHPLSYGYFYHHGRYFSRVLRDPVGSSDSSSDYSEDEEEEEEEEEEDGDDEEDDYSSNGDDAIGGATEDVYSIANGQSSSNTTRRLALLDTLTRSLSLPIELERERERTGDLRSSTDVNAPSEGPTHGPAVIENISRHSEPEGRRSLISSRPLMLTGGLDAYLRIYDLSTGELQGRIHVGSKVSSICILDTKERETSLKRRRGEPQQHRKRTRSSLHITETNAAS